MDAFIFEMSPKRAKAVALFTSIACNQYTTDFITLREGGTVRLDWYGVTLAPRLVNSSWDTSPPPCADSSFPIYVHDTSCGERYARLFRLTNLTEFAKVVASPGEACVEFVPCPFEKSARVGANVLLVGGNEWPENHGDRPGLRYETVLTASTGLAMRAHVAEEYQAAVDVMMPLIKDEYFHNVSGVSVIGDTRSTDNRTILVSFKGTIQPWPMKFYGLRNAIARIDDPGRGVVIHTNCGAPPTTGPPFDRLMRSTHYALAPGGGGADSYRFWEALAFGAIPVVFDNLILPFQGSVDWSPCVVRVSAAAIPTLREKLGALDGLERRHEACRALFRRHMGVRQRHRRHAHSTRERARDSPQPAWRDVAMH